MAETFEKLVSYTTTGSSSTSITLSNIPTSHTDLWIDFNGYGTTGGGGIVIRINGDSGSNYSTTYLWSSTSSNAGTVVSATSGSAGRIIQVGSPDGGGGWALFPNYRETSFYKTWISRGWHNNIVMALLNTWSSTSAISSLTLSIESSSAFYTGFRIDLYGIKKAS